MKDSIYREIFLGLISVIIGVLFTWLSSYYFDHNLSKVFSGISSDEQLMKLFSNEFEQINKSVSIFIGITTTLILIWFSTLYSLRKKQKDTIEEIKNDVLETHAVIKPHENKLAITAKIFKFHDKGDYDNEDFESIDLVRSFTYQDLILSPKYLNYFFNKIKKHNTNNKPIRIIVIKSACQASLTYVVLSYLAGYETRIIGDKYFRDFLESHSPSKNKKEMCNIFKGNPYIEKNGTTYTVNYSIYQSHDDVLSKKTIVDPNIINDVYTILSCLKEYSIPINDTLFERLIVSINELETIVLLDPKYQ
ncbi:hypothetical protein FACS189440_04180 [Bacteroidia bacterium]|nr:hypothetical protein FACS189423_02990 [Bacteroidia bacterium]GHT46355.1 hypothetical protein FACS189440_04180 [Bacteroidia bacterium]